MEDTTKLLSLEIFSSSCDRLDDAERIRIAYLRAREIAKTFSQYSLQFRKKDDASLMQHAPCQEFDLSDILSLSPEFWAFHQNNICAYDMAAFSLMTIQYNLAAGTLATHMSNQAHRQLLDRILKFEISAHFLLTELGHGLDARSLETTATLQPDGTFDLHTPCDGAAKYMPPTSPIQGFPRLGIVFAKLFVHGDERGTRPFVFRLNDGMRMADGVVSSKVLPRRAGSKPLDHSITSFNHVKLPSWAILGSVDNIDDDRANFSSIASRITVGTFAIATTILPIMKRCIYTSAMYSLRRHVSNQSGKSVPIMHFRTQHGPLLHGLAQLLVFEAWIPECIKTFKASPADDFTRHAIGSVVKATLTNMAQSTLYHLAERCGAQGLYESNHIIESQLESRGISISEADTLVLSIRVATSLLTGRHKFMPAENLTSFLSLHETSLLDESRALLSKMKGGHRGSDFNDRILLRCQPFVEAVGHRMAFEAAQGAKVCPKILKLYEIGIILRDSAWYVENCGLSRDQQFEWESAALSAVLAGLDTHMDELGVEHFCKAPIISDDMMSEYIGRLPIFGDHGSARPKTDTSIISRL
ncbi:hypothetical protein HIM_09322 [Hirsutella minnesotensis 3608]|uniref:Acyl-CoA oxidase C-alpha1 domain-containing protein n=1 Tax=Hirsutella minnesotensis 3608 TaxID=1043627 RepID=A0A0F7ZXU1_9HYPO|nr:hypothetical protein HIM_09322 [Hirsutella minnesotensis 3608]